MKKTLNRLNLCFKHAAALGLNVDLQGIAKTLLGKKTIKIKTCPLWIGEIFRLFIKYFAKQQA
ncbi:hypothetical protein BHOIPH601_04500 [Bartonella henselae]